MKIYDLTYRRIKRIALIYALLMLACAVAAFGQSTFSGTRLGEACQNYVQSRLGDDVEITIMQKIKDKYFKESGVTARFSADPAQLRGMCRIELEFSLEDKVLERISIPAKIRIFEETYTSARNLQSGAEITENDIASTTVEISQFEPEDLPLFQEIVGSRLSKNLPKGSVITRAHLEKPRVINRGERVSIMVYSGAVNIRAQGTALNDAASGEEVRVKSENSNSVLSGTAGADGVVYVAGRK